MQNNSTRLVTDEKTCYLISRLDNFAIADHEVYLRDDENTYLYGTYRDIPIYCSKRLFPDNLIDPTFYIYRYENDRFVGLYPNKLKFMTEEESIDETKELIDAIINSINKK